jgi:deoxyadenosine/deoxycytidine kinase
MRVSVARESCSQREGAISRPDTDCLQQGGTLFSRFERPSGSGCGIVSLEGGIGTGKTSLLRKLRHLEGFHVIEEPVAEWEEYGPEKSNELEAFYRDPIRNTFKFQAIVMTTAAAAHRAGELVQHRQPGTAVIIERSPWTGMNCFQRVAVERGTLGLNENALLIMLANAVTAPLHRGTRTIYLRARPAASMERILARARPAEMGDDMVREKRSTIEMSYLKQLHCTHEEWLFPPGGRLMTDQEPHPRPDEPLGRVTRLWRSLDGLAVLVVDGERSIEQIDRDVIPIIKQFIRGR